MNYSNVELGKYDRLYPPQHTNTMQLGGVL